MGSVNPKSRGAVLIVDDDEDLRAMLRDALEYRHYVVLEAEDGKGAFDVLRLPDAPPVRLIILDLVMPGMTGWELIETLRRDPKLSQIPILVSSGVPVHGDASGIGATMNWLRKPFGEHELFEAAKNAIQGANEEGSPARPRGTRRGRVPSHPGH